MERFAMKWTIFVSWKTRKICIEKECIMWNCIFVLKKVFRLIDYLVLNFFLFKIYVNKILVY